MKDLISAIGDAMHWFCVEKEYDLIIVAPLAIAYGLYNLCGIFVSIAAG